MTKRVLSLSSCLLLAASGCGGGDGRAADGGGDGAVGALPRLPCNPLGSGDCLTPFPSAAFLVENKATATGFRVALSEDVLPENDVGVLLDPTFWNRFDGFSSASYILAYFPTAVDAALLPTPSDPSPSLQADSATAIVNANTGARVLHFAELDANAEPDDDRQGLILRPLVRLAPGTRYVVGLRRSLGADVPPGFQAILDGTTTENAVLERLRPGYDDIFAALAKAGMARDDLLLAWEFTTASDAAFIDPTKAMVDEGLAAVPSVTYVVDNVDNYATGNAMRVIEGTFDAPNFVGADGWVADPPEQDGTYTADFTMVIPRAAETAPVPVLIYGHGLFGTGGQILSIGVFGYIARIANDYGFAIVATDWIGLANYDRPALIDGLTDGNQLHIPTERLRQGLVNTAVLGRLARDQFPSDSDFMDGVAPLLSDADPAYWGISLGGIMGQPLLAYDPDVSRAGLGVPGGNWSMLIQRSSNWPEFRDIVRQWYPDTLDELKLLQLAQTLFDFTDPMTTAPYLLSDPPSGGTKSAVMIEALCDSQVPNLATETIARTMGIPVLAPTVDPVPLGLDTVAGPVAMALTRYDLGLDPCPGDDNAPVDTDNGAHLCVNLQPAAEAQVVELITTGVVGNWCAGVCECGPCNSGSCGCTGGNCN